jgi:hypothetical protein
VISPRSAKKGFVNKAKWFLEGFSHSPKLGHARWRLDGTFQVAEVARLKDEHVRGAANHGHGLWSLMVFQARRRLWLKG